MVDSGEAHSNTRRGSAWAACAALAYSLSSVVGKDLLGAMPVASLLLWRFLLAAFGLWAICFVWARRGGPNPMKAPILRLVLLGALLGTLIFIGFQALRRLDASVYIVIVYTYPAFVVIGSALFLGRRIDGRTALALVLVMIGVVLTVPEVMSAIAEVDAVAMAMVFVQAVMLAAYMMLSEWAVPPTLDGFVASAWTMLGAAAAIVPAVMIDGMHVPSTGRIRIELLLFALIPTLLSTAFLYRALRRGSPSLVSLVMMLEVPLAVMWAVTVLGERIGLLQTVGGLVVLSGVLLAQSTAMSRRHDVPRPLCASAPQHASTA